MRTEAITPGIWKPSSREEMTFENVRRYEPRRNQDYISEKEQEHLRRVELARQKFGSDTDKLVKFTRLSEQVSVAVIQGNTYLLIPKAEWRDYEAMIGEIYP